MAQELFQSSNQKLFAFCILRILRPSASNKTIFHPNATFEDQINENLLAAGCTIMVRDLDFNVDVGISKYLISETIFSLDRRKSYMY